MTRRADLRRFPWAMMQKQGEQANFTPASRVGDESLHSKLDLYIYI